MGFQVGWVSGPSPLPSLPARGDSPTQTCWDSCVFITREVPEPGCIGSRGVSAEHMALLREDAFGRQGKGPVRL